ncbi:MAG: PilZ domain-containing protein [Thermodesulfobacteriota bacterium]
MKRDERRKQVRLLAPDGAFAAVAEAAEKVGQIQDISPDGLCFCYLSEKPLCDGSGLGEDHTIDIFVSGQRFFLPNIPCRLVHDQVVGPENQMYSGFCIRHCGVQFSELTPKQKEDLLRFLANLKPGEGNC